MAFTEEDRESLHFHPSRASWAVAAFVASPPAFVARAFLYAVGILVPLAAFALFVFKVQVGPVFEGVVVISPSAPLDSGRELASAPAFTRSFEVEAVIPNQMLNQVYENMSVEVDFLDTSSKAGRTRGIVREMKASEENRRVGFPPPFVVRVQLDEGQVRRIGQTAVIHFDPRQERLIHFLVDKIMGRDAANL